MNIHDVDEGIKKYKKRRRVGRGTGSGLGKTCGRGHNGQRSRAGFSSRPTFEGGQMPLVRRIPKRGFNNRWALTVYSINIGQLDALFAEGDEVNIETLREKNRAKSRFDVLKILGDGELTKKLKISAHRFSKSASEKIAKAGGEAVVVAGKKPVVKGVRKASKAKS